MDEAKSSAKDQVYEHYTQNHQNMKKAGEVLKLLTDDSIAADTPFHDIQKKAFSILERQKLSSLANQIIKNTKWMQRLSNGNILISCPANSSVFSPTHP